LRPLGRSGRLHHANNIELSISAAHTRWQASERASRQASGHQTTPLVCRPARQLANSPAQQLANLPARQAAHSSAAAREPHTVCAALDELPARSQPAGELDSLLVSWLAFWLAFSPAHCLRWTVSPLDCLPPTSQEAAPKLGQVRPNWTPAEPLSVASYCPSKKWKLGQREKKAGPEWSRIPRLVSGLKIHNSALCRLTLSSSGPISGAYLATLRAQILPKIGPKLAPIRPTSGA